MLMVRSSFFWSKLVCLVDKEGNVWFSTSHLLFSCIGLGGLVFILILLIETSLPCRQGGQRFRHRNVSDQSQAWDSYLFWPSTVDHDDGDDATAAAVAAADVAAVDDDDDGHVATSHRFPHGLDQIKSLLPSSSLIQILHSSIHAQSHSWSIFFCHRHQHSWHSNAWSWAQVSDIPKYFLPTQH